MPVVVASSIKDIADIRSPYSGLKISDPAFASLTKRDVKRSGDKILIRDPVDGRWFKIDIGRVIKVRGRDLVIRVK